jgi:hypothetical protein
MGRATEILFNTQLMANSRLKNLFLPYSKNKTTLVAGT